MSLINCSNCNREISDKSIKCIFCGYDNKDLKNKKRDFLLFATLSLMLYIFIYIIIYDFLSKIDIIYKITSVISVWHIILLSIFFTWFIFFRKKIIFNFCNMILLEFYIVYDIVGQIEYYLYEYDIIVFNSLSSLQLSIIHLLIFTIFYSIGIFIFYVLSFKKRKI